MLAGHFSTALIANQKFPKGTLLFFLIASQFQDLLWFTLHFFGVERTTPDDALNATIGNLTADLLYSHDLFPQIFWLIVAFVIGRLLFKSTKIGLAGAVIVAGHFVLDVFSGFPHHVFGAESADVTFGLYTSNVYLAIFIEIVFCIVALWYFFKQDVKNGIQRTMKNKAAIIGVHVVGIIFMLSIAELSFRELFGIPEFDLGFPTNVPTLIITYLTMLFWLNYAVPKYKYLSNIKE